MNKKYEQITFCVKNYTDYDEMMYDVKDCLTVLMRNGYQAQIYDEDQYVVVINYNYRDEEISGVSLNWLDDNDIVTSIEEMENEINDLLSFDPDEDCESCDGRCFLNEDSSERK